MRILVTGASGFVGQALVRRLHESGHEVVVTVREDCSDFDGCEKIVWDYGDPAKALDLPTGFDAIVHAAQARHYRSFPDDCDEMFKVNVGSTTALLEQALATGVSQFCLISTGSIYDPYVGAMEEDAALAPSNFLGASKLAAEVLARPYADKLSLSVLRLFFPYGPGQHDRLVPDIVKRVQDGAPVHIGFADDGLRFTPTFIEDVVRVIEASLVERWTGTYNVASPEQTTMVEFATRIGEIIGTPPIFEAIDRAYPVIVPTVDKLRKRFDLSTMTPLAVGLATMVGQLVKNGP